MRIFENVWVSDTDLKHELVNQVWQMKAPYVFVTQFTAMYTHMQRVDVPASLNNMCARIVPSSQFSLTLELENKITKF